MWRALFNLSYRRGKLNIGWGWIVLLCSAAVIGFGIFADAVMRPLLPATFTVAWVGSQPIKLDTPTVVFVVCVWLARGKS